MNTETKDDRHPETATLEEIQSEIARIARANNLDTLGVRWDGDDDGGDGRAYHFMYADGYYRSSVEGGLDGLEEWRSGLPNKKEAEIAELKRRLKELEG